MFGNEVEIGNKLHEENGIRLAALTQHCKMRFSFGEKLDLHVGLQMMDMRTCKKYKDCVNGKANVLAQRCTDEAVAEG